MKVWALRHIRGGAAVATTIMAGVILMGGAASATPAVDTFQTSFETGQPAPFVASTRARFSAQVDGGPAKQVVLTAKPDVGFTGLRSLHYRGNAGGSQQQKLFDVDVPVRADTQLSYVIFPQRNGDDLRNPANYVAVDLLFDGGSRLSTRGARDQHRIPASARGQGEGRVVVAGLQLHVQGGLLRLLQRA